MPTIEPVTKDPRLGWIPDRPDHRDRIYNCEERIFQPHQLPVKLDPITSMLPVFDQGQIGSCTGNGIAKTLAHAAYREGEGVQTYSRLFIYGEERRAEGTFGVDSGAAIRDGIKVVNTLGAPFERDWPYDPSLLYSTPPQSVYAAATAHEAVQYQRVDLGPGAPFRTALVNDLPVVFGFSVPQYFMDGSWDPVTEICPLPGPNDYNVGGHCVVATGYDFSRSSFPDPFFWVDNSWGDQWGYQGRFRMHYQWVGRLTSDHWTISRIK